MKKRSLYLYIVLTLIASALWLAGSWWHYACNIKNTCDSAETLASSTASNTNNTPDQTVINAQVIDTDGDGLSDDEESLLGTDPLLIDTDEDSISDSEEVGVDLGNPLDSDEDNIIDALDPDDDNDGLSTRDEEQVGTSALHADTDEDGVLDSIEVGKNIKAPLDTDGDGIINALDTDDDDDNIDTITEALLGTNPLLIDTDGDGISDSQEVGNETNKPLDQNKNGILDALETDDSLDQDNDGLTDAIEAILNTNPNKVDTDGDGINDAIEVGSNTDLPLDTDLDGIIDALDASDSTDTDNDGLTDAQEIKLSSNPQLADSDKDGIDDLIEVGKNIDQPLDSDNDGLPNLVDTDDDNDNLSTRYETRIGTNPLTNDSDKDGLLDNIEAKAPNSDELQDTDNDKLINPIDDDDDDDGIPTFDEIALGTDPLKADTDNDGITDADEIGSDLQQPLDSDNDGIIDALDNTADKANVADNNTVKEDNTSVSLELTGSENIDSIQSSILYFPYLSADPVIKDDAADYLDKIATWLKQNPENKINLTGHTDNIGSKQSNLALGIRRVMVIRSLLIERGSPLSQIEIMSKGESKPITSNSTEAGRFKNRRVEIEPIK